jgi:hypothetical protein
VETLLWNAVIGVVSQDFPRDQSLICRKIQTNRLVNVGRIIENVSN